MDQFEAQRVLLLLAHDDGTIDDEELLLFFLALEEDEAADQVSDPHHPRLDIDQMSERRCIEKFRFSQAEIRELCLLLRLPGTFQHVVTRRSWSAVEGMCVVLRRLSYPCRLADLVPLFGRGTTDLSIIFNQTCLFITNTWKGHLSNFTQATYFTPQRVAAYAGKIGQLCPLQNCWGFIDGTVRGMCRPSIHQRIFFNGHKRYHALKYQSIVAADGLIVHLYGPVEGRRHDSGLLRESNLLHVLANNMPVPAPGGTYCVYGDPAYPLRPQLMVPIQGRNLTAQEQQFNTEMSGGRIVVEWGFGKVLQYFSFVDYKKNQKLLLQPIAAHYITAVLLTNCHTCFHGSEAGSHFGLQAPSLQDYLS